MAESLIVSMASYPPRIKTVSHCIRGLLTQSVRPDRILVWLRPMAPMTLYSIALLILMSTDAKTTRRMPMRSMLLA